MTVDASDETSSTKTDVSAGEDMGEYRVPMAPANTGLGEAISTGPKFVEPLSTGFQEEVGNSFSISRKKGNVLVPEPPVEVSLRAASTPVPRPLTL